MNAHENFRDQSQHHRDRPPAAKPVKRSYTIPCASTFRDAVEALARRREVNAADLVRSVALMLAPEAIAAFPDPGGPPADDRETVILKSGKAKGRPWRRKPRLQVRMAAGQRVEDLRRALAIALAMDRGEARVLLDAPNEGLPAVIADREELTRLRATVSALAFEPLPGGINTRAEALHVLGFPPDSRPDSQLARARFRALASIHHPDAEYGSHLRMSQLNSAMEVLARRDP